MLQNYIRVRVIDMTGIDINLFSYDRHFSIYFFAVSPDEQIYLRYGGRDARSADSSWIWTAWSSPSKRASINTSAGKEVSYRRRSDPRRGFRGISRRYATRK